MAVVSTFNMSCHPLKMFVAKKKKGTKCTNWMRKEKHFKFLNI
jgi:hypothetical protein